MSAEGQTFKARLLIVDDEPAILFALGDYLSRRGFAVDLAPSREEGERLVVTSLYDLVIVDLRLGAAEPRGGLEILHRLRDRLSPAPAILLTAAPRSRRSSSSSAPVGSCRSRSRSPGLPRRLLSS
jgi:DNA-binding response OmpR family regulator